MAPCAVVFAQIANKQTNKLNYIYRVDGEEIRGRIEFANYVERELKTKSTFNNMHKA